MLVTAYNLLLILDGDYSSKTNFKSAYVEGMKNLSVPIKVCLFLLQLSSMYDKVYKFDLNFHVLFFSIISV